VVRARTGELTFEKRGAAPAAVSVDAEPLVLLTADAFIRHIFMAAATLKAAVYGAGVAVIAVGAGRPVCSATVDGVGLLRRHAHALDHTTRAASLGEADPVGAWGAIGEAFVLTSLRFAHVAGAWVAVVAEAVIVGDDAVSVRFGAGLVGGAIDAIITARSHRDLATAELAIAGPGARADSTIVAILFTFTGLP